MPPETEPDVLDCRGLRCPLPVLKLEKRVEAAAPGTLLVVLATDPMAKIDIPLYCRQHGHNCTVTTEGDVLRFEVVRG
ncbi:MAG: sulfurtransferase TusA family protein [Alphaproteobacteria bacterium]|nr:MAG: sulfurtransferase TusA family protein [Alphaproteobacteria bacterium]